ncbi:hypothetical protein DM02DRAFT_664721 [Periconia macrospinosa]|uniref:Uncharacterized protein n=1 Tax=Periconia macrospinosa TaxID=97972 RepID=A0A2V1D0G9_9PLEO|nr:hypothetical protein DM02DRAFT_664721 [Periconia macrospinosa]
MLMTEILELRRRHPITEPRLTKSMSAAPEAQPRRRQYSTPYDLPAHALLPRPLRGNLEQPTNIKQEDQDSVEANFTSKSLASSASKSIKSSRTSMQARPLPPVLDSDDSDDSDYQLARQLQSRTKAKKVTRKIAAPSKLPAHSILPVLSVAAARYYYDLDSYPSRPPSPTRPSLPSPPSPPLRDQADSPAFLSDDEDASVAYENTAEQNSEQDTNCYCDSEGNCYCEGDDDISESNYSEGPDDDYYSDSG